ncbi:hypothetical protein, variant 1 [Aphanomyces invadans]|uniref:Transmembrane protein n=1 Tax=Aphanomyces invadans TaxID=157072 RepID=A0A024UDK4_9STRA|nr:hypothetical protein, variant 1 [Aphanomyces invadans]ETW03947.1 hypothetical protein, variant 1 [Aphanomyces invadans]|eukprot:XP_008866903.1 hypothetical protein, variant 1 [Aphanomyces invadans]
MHMSTEDTARPTQAATANPTSTNGEEEPLLSAQPAPTVVTNNDGRTWIDTNPLSRWIVSQWEETYEFEALCVETTRNALGIPSYSWRGLPLLYAAMIVGIAIAVVVDGLTYKDDNDDDDDDSDRKSKSWQRHPSSTDLSDMIHQYTWYHVLVAVLVFNACYSLAAYRANLNGWRLFLQRCKEVCIVVAQVLFFLNIFGTVHVSWMWVAAPVIVWTLLLVLRLQWQALVGLTAILAAFKLSSAAADAQWTWTMVFTPIWVLLVCIASLWLLLREKGSYVVRGYWIPQVFAFFFVAVPWVIKMQVFPQVDSHSPPSANATAGGPGQDVVVVDDSNDDNWFAFRYWWLLLVWVLPPIFFLAHMLISVRAARVDGSS